MNSEILQTFHQRLLPLFTPQSEKLLQRLDPTRLQQVAFRYIFSLESMHRLGQMIEDGLMAAPGSADLHLSFQQFARLGSQEESYRRRLASATGLWIYGEADAADLNLPSEVNAHFVDTSNTLLTRYWCAVAYGPAISMSLLAEQVSALSGDELYYEGFYSFEPEVAYQIVSILHEIFPDSVPLPASPDEE
jgi:hypothetical protein